MAPSLLAGVASGMMGLLAFLVVHHVWIVPIWFIAPVGTVVAVLGGLAVGFSYLHIQKGLPARPLTALGVFLLVVAMLLPGMLLSFTHGPLFDVETGAVPKGQGASVFFHFALELLLPAAMVGGVAGYRLGRSPRAALATALAAVAWAFGPGHNIPMFGTNPVAFKGHAIVLAVALVSSVTLVSVTTIAEKRWQAGRRKSA